MSLKAFKLCFDRHSTFLLFSRMLNEFEAVCSSLSTLLGVYACALIGLSMMYHVRIYSNSGVCSLELNTRPLVSFVESNVDNVLKPSAHLRQSTSFIVIHPFNKSNICRFPLMTSNSCFQFLFRNVQMLKTTKEIGTV